MTLIRATAAEQRLWRSRKQAAQRRRSAPAGVGQSVPTSAVDCGRRWTALHVRRGRCAPEGDRGRATGGTGRRTGASSLDRVPPCVAVYGDG